MIVTEDGDDDNVVEGVEGRFGGAGCSSSGMCCVVEVASLFFSSCSGQKVGGELGLEWIKPRQLLGSPAGRDAA